MTVKEVEALPKPQRDALNRLHTRIDPDKRPSWEAFCETVHKASYDDVIMVPLWGMWIGVEKDGYTHS